MSQATNQDTIISSTMRQAASIMRSARSLLESAARIVEGSDRWEAWSEGKELGGISFNHADPADEPIPDRMARYFWRNHSTIKGVEELCWLLVDFGNPSDAAAEATCSFSVAWRLNGNDEALKREQLSILHRQPGFQPDGVTIHYLHESEFDKELREMGFLIALSLTTPLSTIRDLDTLKRELVDALLGSTTYTRFANGVERAPAHLRNFWKRLAEKMGSALSLGFEFETKGKELERKDVEFLGSEYVSLSLYPEGQRDWWFAIEQEKVSEGRRLYVGVGNTKKRSLMRKGCVPGVLQDFYPDVQKDAEDSKAWIGWKYVDLKEALTDPGPLSLAWVVGGRVDEVVNVVATQALAELERVWKPLLAQAKAKKDDAK